MGLARRLMALITLTFQLIMTSLGALSACVDSPHRHAGVPVPDCAMHHQPSATATSDHHQHHADPGTTSNTKRIACRCASDAMSVLVGDAAALPDVVSVSLPNNAPAIVAFMRTIIDIRVAPLSPPPQPLPA